MMMKNKAGGAGGGMSGSGEGAGPTAAAAAAALQKQKALLQRVETDITSVVDNFTQIVNVARVSDIPPDLQTLDHSQIHRIDSIEDYHRCIGQSFRLFPRMLIELEHVWFFLGR